MDKEITINERIKIVRHIYKMGREEFAQQTGINKLTLRNIEQGKQKPYAWHLEKIAELSPQLGFWALTGIMLGVDEIEYKPDPYEKAYINELIKMEKTGVKSETLKKMQEKIEESEARFNRILEEEKMEDAKEKLAAKAGGSPNG